MNNTAVYPNMLSVKKAADKFGISEYFLRNPAALARCALSVLATAGWSIWTALPPTSTRATTRRSWKAVMGKAEWDVRAKESCPAGSPRHQIKKKNALCRLVTRCYLIGVLLLYPWGPDISTFSRQMNQAGNALFSFRHQKWRH